MSSAIANFYAGRSVFITGGTGFLGKQITEKLLRSCPDIDSIYLLIRAKTGENVHQRLKKTLESPLFDVLRQKQPDFSKKVIPVTGDVRTDFLGISDADHRCLSSNVSVVIHSAATVSFVKPLREAVNTNVLGVRRMLGICKQLPKIEAFVHISTAYSQVDKGNNVFEEKIYDPPVSPEKIIEMTRLLDDDYLALITPELLRRSKHPNTYTLTKAIAEKLVEQERSHVPSCVTRPAVITGSQLEPFPGWADNFFAGNGLYGAIGTGTARFAFCEKPKGKCKLDFVPVDRIANQLVVAAWQTAINKSLNVELPVYNMVSNGFHTVHSATTSMIENSRRYPYSKLHPARYSLTGLPAVTHNRILYSYFHDIYLPLRFRATDILLGLTGKKSSLYRTFNNNQKLMDLLTYFTTNEFDWEYKRIMTAHSEFNDVDKELFNCKLNDMDAEAYYRNWWHGLRKYAFKDSACTETLQLPTVNVSVQPNVINNGIHL